MKIALLGAAGFVGRAAARALSARAEVRELLLVDYDVRAAKKLARSLSPPCRWAMADAGRAPDLERLLPGVDAVASAVGPCRRYEKAILLACAAAKRAAASVGDGVLTADDRREIHEAFRRAGVAAVSGCGLWPGWTELLASHFLPAARAAAATRFFFWSPDRFGGYAFFRRLCGLTGPTAPAPPAAPGGIYRLTTSGDLSGVPPSGAAVRRLSAWIGLQGACGLEFAAAFAYWLRNRLKGPPGTPAAAAGLAAKSPEGPPLTALVTDPAGELPGVLLAAAAVRLAVSPPAAGLVPLPEAIGREEAAGLARAAGALVTVP